MFQSRLPFKLGRPFMSLPESANFSRRDLWGGGRTECAQTTCQPGTQTGPLPVRTYCRDSPGARTSVASMDEWVLAIRLASRLPDNEAVPQSAGPRSHRLARCGQCQAPGPRCAGGRVVHFPMRTGIKPRYSTSQTGTANNTMISSRSQVQSSQWACMGYTVIIK